MISPTWAAILRTRSGTCVEYEVARDDAQFVSAVDGLLDDVGLYGDGTYDHFVAVIYATGDCAVRQADLGKLLQPRLSRQASGHRWEFLVVVGAQANARRPGGGPAA